MSVVTAKQTFQQLIRRSFVIPTIAALFAIVCLGALFMDKTIEEIRYQDVYQNHQILSRLLQPSLQISDTANLTQVLSLAQNPNRILAVVDNSGDIITADNANLEIIQALTSHSSNSRQCPSRAYFMAKYRANYYRAFCTTINQPEQLGRQGVSTALGVLWSFDLEDSFPVPVLFALIFLLFVIFLTAILAFWIYFRLKRRLFDPLDHFKSYILSGHFGQDDCLRIEKNMRYELQEVYELRQLFEVFVKSTKRSAEIEKQAALGKVALQVAHDIRSPLAALSIVLNQLDELPAERRQFLREVADHINGIANDLLQRYRIQKSDYHTDQPSSKICAHILAQTVESIVYEKRLQWQSSPISLDLNISPEAKMVFVSYDLQSMKRALSNLLNNALESISHDHGRICVSMIIKEGKCCIMIEDNGCGVASDQLEMIMRPGVTSKANGTGIGLSYADHYIQSLSGSLSLKSSVGLGTSVCISMPIEKPSSCFVTRLIFKKGYRLLILDDSDLVHKMWDERLRSLNGLIEIHHFSTVEAFDAFYATAEPANLFVLSDYEMNESKNGLDVLTSLPFQPCNKLLVTSYYDHQEVVRQCELNNIHLLPKYFLPCVPIELISV